MNPSQRSICCIHAKSLAQNDELKVDSIVTAIATVLYEPHFQVVLRGGC